MNGIILFVAMVFVLWIGRSILIPLLIATFIWYLINAIAAYYRMIMPYRESENKPTKKHRFMTIFFDWVSTFLALVTLGGLGYLFATQIRPTFTELMYALPALQMKLVALGKYLSQYLGISFDAGMIPNITQIAANVGASVASIVTSTGMILVYIIFMFVEQSTFHKKFDALFPNKHISKKMNYIFSSIDENMKKYLFMKTLISAGTGIMSYMWLSIIGLEFAGVWAFIIFILNYIPTIGSIIACALPIIYSLTVAETFQLPLLTAAGLVALQFMFGNLLEPKLMGKALNISTLAILINLVFWGMIWGVAGMFFSVPLLVAILIITAQFDSTRWIAILLSADGVIPDKRED